MNDGEKYLARNVKRENDSQYGDWPLTADTRRDFILNGVSTAEGDVVAEKLRDIWEEAAERFDGVSSGRILDSGTSSGYFVEKLLERGHGIDTQVVGIDTQAAPFPGVEKRLNARFGERNVILKKDDASKINEPKNSFDATSGQYLIYHMGIGEKLLSELHRVGKPDSLTVMASRGPRHLANSWALAKKIAFDNKAHMPEENFYTHFPLKKLVNMLQKSEKFEVLEVVEQKEVRMILPDAEGWKTVLDVALSYLPLMRKGGSGPQLRYSEIEGYIESVLRKEYFESFADYCGGSFPEHIQQGFVVARVIK